MDLIISQSSEIIDSNSYNLTKVVSNFLDNFLSSHTKKAYTLDFYDFVAFLSESGENISQPNEITKAHIIEYREYLREHYSPNTLQRKLSSLSSLFAELQNAHLMEHNPVKGVKRPKAVSLRPKTGLSDSEINKLTSFYNGKSIQSLQNKTILTFLSYTGCRVNEMRNVRVSDISFEQDLPVVKIQGKGAKFRKIPLNPKARKK